MEENENYIAKINIAKQNIFTLHHKNKTFLKAVLVAHTFHYSTLKENMIGSLCFGATTVSRTNSWPA